MTTATITQTMTVSDAAPGWSVPLHFDQFDPSIGTPLDVQVGVVGSVTGSVSIENLGATAASVVVSFPSHFLVTGAGNAALTSVAVDPEQTIQLGAYDGSRDFGGGSGTVVPVISSTGSAVSVFTPGTVGPVAFVGTGPLDLAVSNSATSAVNGNGNLLAVTHAEAGASVSVQYDYKPAGGGGSGNTSGSGLQVVVPTIAGLNSGSYKATSVQTLVISDQTSGWNTSVAIKQFDPTLGTLIAVNETLIADLNGWFGAENLSSALGSVNMTDTGDISVRLPGVQDGVSVRPLISSGVSVGAFDGTADFTGRSGIARGGLVNTQTTVAQIPAFSTDLSSFIGGGTVGLAVSSAASSVVTGPADLESELRTLAGAVIQISYVYEPFSTPVTPAGAPSITGAVSGQATTEQTSVVPFGHVVIADSGAGQTQTVTLVQSDAANGTLTNLGSGTYNATIGVYTDTGSAAEVTAALQGLVFVTAAHRAVPGQTATTTFTLTDTDSAGVSITDGSSSVVTMTGTVAPVISGVLGGQAVGDTGRLKPFADVAISDANFGQAETVTVVLSAVANGTLTSLGGGSYDALTGIYRVTGSAIAVTVALDNLVFVPTQAEVAPGQSVTTGFTIGVTDSALAGATDSTTSVVATAAAAAVGQIILHGASSQYRIADDNGTLYVQDTVVGRDGSQALPGITELVFTDGVGVFDPTGAAENVARLYQGILGRAGEAGGLEDRAGRIDSGAMSLADVASAFVGSAEFLHSAGPLSSVGFINRLYQNGLGRLAEDGGVQAWGGAISAGLGAGGAAVAIADSAEAKAHWLGTAGDSNNGEVYRLYQTALGRAPEGGGQTHWSGLLASGATVAQVAQGFVGSVEFQADYGSLSVSDFVTALYQNALHRAPDSGGLQHWVQALQGGASTADVVAGFADSLESRILTAPATHANWVFIAS